MNNIHMEVLLASGYAVFLVGVATCLEMVGRHTHERSSRQYHTAGFTYHQHQNVWECPAGQYLKLWAFDSRRGVAQYRAEAKSCNSCALKTNCTDSDDGRKLDHHLDSWLRSEVRRFHRGISLALLLLAGLILTVEMTLHATSSELSVLLLAMLLVAVVARRVVSTSLV